MKHTVKLLGVAAAAISLTFWGSTTLAANGQGSGRGSPGGRGGAGGNFQGGGSGGRNHGGGSGGRSYSGGGNHGGSSGYYGNRSGGNYYGGGYYNRNCYGSGYYGGRYYGGARYGGYGNGYYGGGGWYPWGLSSLYNDAPLAAYFPADPPPPVYYPPPPVPYSPPTVYIMPAAAAASTTEPQVVRGGQGQLLTLAGVKALAKASLSDAVIISQIRSSRTVYHLTTAEIIDLKQSGVSDKIIDYMINTAS